MSEIINEWAKSTLLSGEIKDKLCWLPIEGNFHLEKNQDIDLYYYVLKEQLDN